MKTTIGCVNMAINCKRFLSNCDIFQYHNYFKNKHYTILYYYFITIVIVINYTI